MDRHARPAVVGPPLAAAGPAGRRSGRIAGWTLETGAVVGAITVLAVLPWVLVRLLGTAR